MDSNVTQSFITFSKPFIDAARNVFETMIFAKIQTQKPSIKTDSVSHGDISAILGLNGRFDNNGKTAEFKGLLVLSWPTESYLKVASSLIGEPCTELNELVTDAGAEITNMIMGNAKQGLKALGYTMNMAIPTTVTGKNHTISYPPNSVTILIPVECPLGSFYIELCYSVQNIS